MSEGWFALEGAAVGFIGGLAIEWMRQRSDKHSAAQAFQRMSGLAALWISGRLGERIREKDPNRLADRASRLFVDSVLRAMAP